MLLPKLLSATIFLLLGPTYGFEMVNHKKLPDRAKEVTDVFEATPEFPRDYHLKVQIKDSECYSSGTISRFIVNLGTLSFNNTLLYVFPISSDQFVLDEKTRTRSYERWVSTRRLKEHPLECFEKGDPDDPCSLRADVIFIDYQDDPKDSWSIQEIKVQSGFYLGKSANEWYSFAFEHSVMLPCSSWMREPGYFQIGPRSGLFITHKANRPKLGSWIRDWV